MAESRRRSAESSAGICIESTPYSRLVSFTELTDTAPEKPAVHGEELRPDDAGQRKPCGLTVGDLAISRPRVMAAGCDHRQHGVTGAVEFSVAEHQG